MPVICVRFSFGNVDLYDGVAYWFNDSGKKVTSKHMPLKEVVVDSSQEIKDIFGLQAAQSVQIAATALSTGLIWGKLSEYFGLVESARVLLLDKNLVEESQGIAEQFMVQLAVKRNALLSLIDNLVSYVDSASERHASLMLDYCRRQLS